MSRNSHKSDWNELEYISWKEFKKMAPPIIKLEMNRIGKLISSFNPGSESYNAWIKARHELSQFVECLDNTAKPPLPDSCADHLSRAILNLSLSSQHEIADSNERTQSTLHYILDRLNYVLGRIGMIY